MSEKFESWAIVELFGHVTMAGKVSEQTIAGAAMLRLDVPAVEDVAGGFTRFYGSSAIYSITPTDEATARRAVKILQARPITICGVVALERQIEARLAGEGEGIRLGGFFDEDEDYPDEDEDDDYPDEDESQAIVSREQVSKAVRDLLAENPVFLDTETTGLEEDDEVVEIAVVDVGGNVLFDELIRPHMEILGRAIEVHGITNEMVENARSFEECVDDLGKVLALTHVIIYRAEFDLRMLAQSAEACNIVGLSKNNYASVNCAMELYADFYGEWDENHQHCRWQSLTGAMEQQEITLPEGLIPHRARADAELTRLLCLKMAEG